MEERAWDTRSSRHGRQCSTRLHLYDVSGTGKSVGTEGRLEVAKGWERGEVGTACSQGTDFLLERQKYVIT